MRSKSGMLQMPAFRDRMPPGLGGVALVPVFLPRPKREGRFKGDNHSGMSHIDECGCGRPKPKIVLHPPL